jgi:hypothetical protein
MDGESTRFVIPGLSAPFADRTGNPFSCPPQELDSGASAGFIGDGARNDKVSFIRPVQFG